MADSSTKPQAKTLSETEAMQQRILALADLKEKQGQGTAQACKVVQLPLWPDTVRAVPNGFLRSALFGAIRKGRRRFVKGEHLAALDGIDIHYTGERLDQGDLDVYESILHAVRLHAMGEQCRVTSYALLKLMGKTDTGKNRATLQTRIERLRANAIRMKQGRYSFIGGLVDEAYKDEETQEWVIVLNPKLRALYGADQFTQVEWGIRHALDGHQLAQWLHGYYASHARPFPVRVETLHRLCGSEAERLDHFRETLRKALGAVAKASESRGQPFVYSIRDDLVHVQRTPSGPQQRQLRKASRKPRKPGP